MMQPGSGSNRADYGIDAPGVVRTLAVLGGLCILLAVVSYFGLGTFRPELAHYLVNLGLWPGFSYLLGAALMVLASKVGKLRERDRLLNAIPWRGDETVLDIGCGRGLLLIGAAKRLTTGKAIGVDRKAIGVDLWQKEDQTGNRPEATRENVGAEGVADRVEVCTGDARQLPFRDAAFDVVVSSWALHNIYNPGERRQALCEIVRVLKSGGRVAILDIRHTREYARVLRESGLGDVTRSWPRFLFVIPTHALTGRKPHPSSEGTFGRQKTWVGRNRGEAT